MAGAVRGGVDAAVGGGALQVAVAGELGLGAVPVVPLLVAVGARRVAGQGVAAGVAGVVAVGLQGMQGSLEQAGFSKSRQLIPGSDCEMCPPRGFSRHKTASMRTKSKEGAPGKTCSEDLMAGSAANFAVSESTFHYLVCLTYAEVTIVLRES